MSQNKRPSGPLMKFGKDLAAAHNIKYPTNPMPFAIRLTVPLEAKVFYIHKVTDRYDADNISKPLWDALQKSAYGNDNVIKYLETLKMDFGKTPDRFELDITMMDEQDFVVLFDFMYSKTSSSDRLVYVAISDFQSKNVRFI
ncbi:RusA family crossover junction endodeoxyribonuclease [Algoriphagus antarcticus]|uniref:RusA family crossover junction endodeoxyribonuclease n=1 Tax=Algoriphagus antarcticus TaxID=238540 RepID=UPI00196A7045|nr:RusA family crossover junction endodeoxyribonuclease [Algoriphagus antarcticus]